MKAHINRYPSGTPKMSLIRSKSNHLIGYPALRQKVHDTLLLGQQRIEREKVRTYWQAGKYILDHLLRNQKRAGYGDLLIEKLAKDIGLDESVLKRIVKFAQTFQIGAARHLLTWAHYRALITVRDEEERRKLEKLAIAKDWPSRALEIQIRNLHWENRVQSSDDEVPQLKPPELGPFYTYKIIRPETIHSRSNELLLDLGFRFTIETDRFEDLKFKPDTIVASVKDSKGRYSIEEAKDAGAESLYTYKAFVERVIDGDTLKVEIDLGFQNRFREIIRLKSIDAPELDTPEGKAAKKFVEDELNDVEFITIKSTRSEKWGRWLGDVFYVHKGDTRKGNALTFLNQLLLDEGHAVRVQAW